MNMKIKRIFLVMLLCTLWLTGFAQKVIKGTVKDSSGEPLIGATVSLGGGQGTVTDMDGNFSLSNVNSNSVMTISYVGCKNQQVKVGNKTDFNVILQSTDKSLDEVVVIGYGTMKKRDLTGSVATINNEKLSQYLPLLQPRPSPNSVLAVRPLMISHVKENVPLRCCLLVILVMSLLTATGLNDVFIKLPPPLPKPVL